MRARRTDRLTKEDYKGIIKWLEGRRHCPFELNDACKTQCSDLFPGSKYTGTAYQECPCLYYSSEQYVRRVAKKVLKEAGYAV